MHGKKLSLSTTRLLQHLTKHQITYTGTYYRSNIYIHTADVEQAIREGAVKIDANGVLLANKAVNAAD